MRVLRSSFFSIILFVFVFSPFLVFAQDESVYLEEQVFKARVMKVLESKHSVREDGTESVQQRLSLLALEGKLIDREIYYDGTTLDVLSNVAYAEGDTVFVHYTQRGGEETYMITGYVRENAIYLLAALLALIVIVIGRFKGFRALLVLLFTFVIILQFIIPRILAGQNALAVTIVGSLIILTLAIYVTEGFHRNSTIAVAGILFSLMLTGFFSVWFTSLTKLTGFASEEAMYLLGISGGNINLHGLLLAGIIIGALGVLDDIVISQVALVQELKNADSKISRKVLYKRAMRVGISHLSSIVNTLFLAYAGASLPLLMLFHIKQQPFLTVSQVINNEIIATEIVRTLTGSIGIVLAVPIATLLAVRFVRKDTAHEDHYH